MQHSIIDEPVDLNNSSNTHAQTSFLSWVVVLSAAMFFFYEFIQMNMLNAISKPLMDEFLLTGKDFGILFSYYFVANVIFLFPAGMLLDRCGTRNVILVSLGICILGTVFFAFAPNVRWASIFRFMTGIGSAFCFLSVIRLATRWFPAQKMALVTGVIVTFAMAGGVVAQTPMVELVSLFGWRHALVIDGGFGIIILLWIAFIVKDYPKGQAKAHSDELKEIAQIGYWKSIQKALLRFQNWVGGIYTCFMNLPIILLGGSWGILYLVDTQGLSKIHASHVTSMLFLGTIIGSPLAGWISDKIEKRRLPMIIGAIMALGLSILLVTSSDWGYYSSLVLFLSLGIVTATQIISYPTVAENSPRMITAMSVSVVSFVTQGGVGLADPLFGRLMDLHVFHRLHHMSRDYLGSDFYWAMIIFPVGIVIALIAALGIRETYCKSKEDGGSEDTIFKKNVV